MIYTVVKIFGVDAIKISAYSSKEKAEANIKKWLKVLDPNEDLKILYLDNEIHYLINKSENSSDHIIFILKETKLK